MSRWFKFYDDALYDPGVQRLGAEGFWAALEGAMKGEQTPFSKWLKRGPDRPPPSEWMAIRKRIFQRDDYTCTYCGERGKALECDHIHPVSRGGSHDDENLTTACRPCNRAKRNKTVSEWRAAHD